jgi:hypothetical protein
MARKKVAQMREDFSRQLEREEEERRVKEQERQARIHHEKARCENPTSKVRTIVCVRSNCFNLVRVKNVPESGKGKNTVLLR